MTTYVNVNQILECELPKLLERVLHDGQTKRVTVEPHCMGGACVYTVTVDTSSRFGPSNVYGIKWQVLDTHAETRAP